MTICIARRTPQISRGGDKGNMAKPQTFSTAAYSKKRHRQAISNIDRMPNIGGDPFSGRSCCASGRGAAHVGG
jgi:hypothetical protein